MQLYDLCTKISSVYLLCTNLYIETQCILPLTAYFTIPSKQAITQITNQPNNWPTDRPTDYLQANQPINEPINQPTQEATSFYRGDYLLS